MSLEDLRSQISTTRSEPMELQAKQDEGAVVLAAMDEMTAQLDAMYLDIGALGMYQHRQAIANICAQLRTTRDAFQATIESLSQP